MNNSLVIPWGKFTSGSLSVFLKLKLKTSITKLLRQTLKLKISLKTVTKCISESSLLKSLVKAIRLDVLCVSFDSLNICFAPELTNEPLPLFKERQRAASVTTATRSDTSCSAAQYCRYVNATIAVIYSEVGRAGGRAGRGGGVHSPES